MLLVLAVHYFFCCPKEEFSCEDISAVIQMHLMGILYILSWEHFSDAQCKSSSLININKNPNQKRRWDTEYNGYPHTAGQLLPSVLWHSRPAQKFLWLMAQQWGLNYPSKVLFPLSARSSSAQTKELQCAVQIFHDVIFAISLGRAVICGFLSSPECEYCVSLSAMEMWMHTVP